MIRSMTGYGRAEAIIENLNIMVEIKSVNHRYFDFSSRQPRSYGFLEENLKQLLQTRVSRGKIDVQVMIQTMESPPATEVVVDHSLAEGYLSALREICGRYQVTDDISVMSLAKYDGIFTVRKPPVDEESIWAAVKVPAEEALRSFMQMRESEGERLRQDVLNHIKAIKEKVVGIEKLAPVTVREYRERIEQKVRELLESNKIDEQRLLTETALFAEKIAVDEETVRLRSHLGQMDGMLSAEEATGRKLDFLVQEMNREVNTIGSKAQNVEITRLVVDIKAELEKIREQVQNIE